MQNITDKYVSIIDMHAVLVMRIKMKHGSVFQFRVEYY